MADSASSIRRLTLEEFTAEKGPEGLEQLMGMINGGSFMQCHTEIAQATGIWIEELVPVFQKLDAMLATRDLPREAGISG
jgi:hypothetical protein